MKNIHIVLSVIFVILCDCSKDNSLTPTTFLSGKWGGKGVEILTSDTQVILNFNCASGLIDKKVVITDNQFLEKGTYTPVAGNAPINISPAPPQNVQYEGIIANEILTLTIKSEDGKTDIGTYTVSKSIAATIVRCM